jgi:ADP-ribosylglycohydrolase
VIAADGPTVEHGELWNRAAGALWGLAVGDALGMPTQLLSPARIGERFGAITTFETPDPDHPIAAGLPAGSVTDDTEQALLLAQVLQPGGHLDQRRWATALRDWESRVRARGSLDLLGPSTRRALHALQDGVPVEEAGHAGVTNGAAMRIAPLAIAVAADPLDRLVDRVVEASQLTHNTSVALSAAAAVAGAVSAALDGAGFDEMVAVAVGAADVAATRGRWVAGASVARRIELSVERVRRLEPAAVPAFVADVIGTSMASQESVPAAFALCAAFPEQPWRVVCTAASVGGDSDTIAAMAGAIMGARAGVDAWPSEAVQTVRRVNGLDIDPAVARLLELRCR